MNDLVGIVLIGGKSTRMGKDKSQLTINSNILAGEIFINQEKRPKNLSFAALAKLKLSYFLDDVYYSINKNQIELNLENTIIDIYEAQGPLTGIISALKITQSSVLVLGVDLPFLKKENIESLLQARNIHALVTSYYHEQKNMWEPMLSIWELESLPFLEEYFQGGGRSIQAFLNQLGAHKLSVLNPRDFVNINTSKDYQALTKGI